MRLAETCQICGGSRWCGRPCRHAPVTVDIPVVSRQIVDKARRKEYQAAWLKKKRAKDKA
jgi:hypothetical protein